MLFIFNLTQYDRIVYLDTDMYPLRNMDEFFDLPDYFLYAPRAHWLTAEQPWVTNCMMVLTPLEATLLEIKNEFTDRVKKKNSAFGMHVINYLYRNRMSILPFGTIILNGHLRGNPTDKSSHIPYKTIEDAARSAYAVHFSEQPNGQFGKPWYIADRTVHGEAHPLYRRIFDNWFRGVDQYCVNPEPN
ncbi:uncharacterized protein SPPG_08165 [Spizellomyces punctatus DAOM BR117]|uniref:Uncharacterized protein n=1 Tax=Spizellomyces punctatus (strain DAOM BR117) TaxID=645134 RepID=A0A0L0H6T6_SPIPD|nr:uncharacterized protein SPPG_08165 [Spizellomyces punctatus DAOM BR117]KNC96581.1 hypothetical protein SPPG_08165 [Spizellomyces punctatus DAOM BR117]|eukprot:XP_016604621.1 hypothetical protein SPPG_08165 [Spizellomyces punctatus DAOM BR117]